MLTTLLSFAFVIGVLVFVHELGHFLAARRVGVRVLAFSVGFGPRLLGFTRGGTEYKIAAIPLGGFVKMAGETAEDQRSGAPDEFLSKSKWQRFQVLIAGPAMNIALAVVVLWGVLLQGADLPAYRDMPPVVGAIEADAPARTAGVQVGDRILRVDDRAVETWDDFLITIAGKARREVTLLVDRGGQQMRLGVVPAAEGKYEIGEIGVLPNTHPHIRSVIAGEPADKAGLKAEDVILAINGETVSFARQISALINKQRGGEIAIRFARNGQEQEVRLTPIKRAEKTWAIGIGISDQLTHVDPGVFEALTMSVAQNWEATGLIFRTLGGLFTGETSPRQLMGPVGIASLSGESAQAGIIPLLGLLASISLNLGLLNLMPIPVLDGGHILILLLEGIARRDFSMRMKERMLFAGLVLLMLLMVTVIYNDLTRIRWVENLMFWR
ncbi:MAG: RIP metalloprotease RseP [Vicinamibacteria bacterium]|nr:RIP metalloprotease RseP [Vicinamibacteria bacterium]